MHYERNKWHQQMPKGKVMNTTRVAAALAGTGVLALATLPATQAERLKLVDPLFGNAGQAACTAAQAGHWRCLHA